MSRRSIQHITITPVFRAMATTARLLVLAIMVTGSVAYSKFETTCTLPETVTNYVSSPNTRGLLEIIWTSLATVITCTYTVLHLNVPENGASDWQLTYHNTMWAIITIIAPEIVLCKAIMDWSKGYKHWRDLKPETKQHWTLTHMLYADMGGFFYCAESTHTEAIKKEFQLEGFVLRAKVLKKADQQGILPLKPPVTEAEILDKSKSNCFEKIVTMGQLLYFCTSIIARVIEKLPITQLELTVCGFAVCSISTYIFTFAKPKGVNTRTVFRHGDFEAFERMLMIAAGPEDDPIQLQVAAQVDNGSASTCTVRMESSVRLGSNSRHLTPVPTGMEVVKSELVQPEPSALEAQRKREANDKRRKRASAEASNALQSIKNNPFSGDFNAAWILVPLVSIPVGAVHVAGWNLHFPTLIELWLWRVAAIVSTAILPLGLFAAVTILLLLALVEDHVDIPEELGMWLIIITGGFVSLAYVGSRLVLIVEMLRCLFFLQPEAFQATWASNVPHIG
ncbi:hypothetical protein LTR97_004012 [Elasticomyces elasticus]|uniref:Transmembrane protein n=1 Tax=Elasticomyces elasticus TaxID=574655 RepID=A0AAN7WNA3_9PEZI|nr:hypothetical protein LTR97_004012 [Elasticomyces elasticus]